MSETYDKPFCFADRSVLSTEPLMALYLLNAIPLRWITNEDLSDEVLSTITDVTWNLVLTDEDLLVQLCRVGIFEGKEAADECEQNDAT